MPQENNFRQPFPPEPGPSSDTDPTAFIQRPPINLPLNLGDWVAPATLRNWVLEDISKLETTNSQSKSEPSLVEEARPKLLLAILTLAYLTQTFTSQEIVRACHADPLFRELCGGKTPFVDELEHFRRTHRPLLERMLGQILLRAVKEHFLQDGELPPGLIHSLLGTAADQIDTARHMSTWDQDE